jgi:hypothetical protein
MPIFTKPSHYGIQTVGAISPNQVVGVICIRIYFGKDEALSHTTTSLLLIIFLILAGGSVGGSASECAPDAPSSELAAFQSRGVLLASRIPRSLLIGLSLSRPH